VLEEQEKEELGDKDNRGKGLKEKEETYSLRPSQLNVQPVISSSSLLFRRLPSCVDTPDARIAALLSARFPRRI